MEMYCPECRKVFKNKDYTFCPYCTTPLKSRVGRQPIPRELRHLVFQRDNYRCRECGATNKETTLEIDHIIPVAKGGTNDINNLQTLCKECNRSKYTDKWVGGQNTTNRFNSKLNNPKITNLNKKQKEINLKKYLKTQINDKEIIRNITQKINNNTITTKQQINTEIKEIEKKELINYLKTRTNKNIIIRIITQQINYNTITTKQQIDTQIRNELRHLYRFNICPICMYKNVKTATKCWKCGRRL